MKKHTIKRPIIKKFIIGSLSAGLLVGGGAMELNAALSMEVYAADTTQETEGEEAAPTEAETPEPAGLDGKLRNRNQQIHRQNRNRPKRRNRRKHPHRSHL